MGRIISATGTYEDVVATGLAFAVKLYGGFGCARDGARLNGGAGAYVWVSIPTTPGETLRVYVGQGGSISSGGSWPNGGIGHSFPLSGEFAGDGGGSTDIRRSPYTTADILALAGGGGGGAEGGSAAATGVAGDGGYPTGANASGGDFPGFGGTQVAAGAGGGTAGAGGFWQGGSGDQSNGNTRHGGGGGGGYYGGGGGAGFGCGGGGSSFVAVGVTLIEDGLSPGTFGLFAPDSGANGAAEVPGGWAVGRVLFG